MEGSPDPPLSRGQLSTEVIVAVSDGKCERRVPVFYRAPNGAIMEPGINGYVPASCIICVRRLPDYKVLWSHLSKQRGSTSAPVIGTGCGSKGDRDGSYGIWRYHMGRPDEQVRVVETNPRVAKCLSDKRQKYPYMKWKRETEESEVDRPIIVLHQLMYQLHNAR